MQPLATIVPEVACVLVCAVAAAVDVRRYKIPNWLTGYGGALGLSLNLALATAAGGVEVGLRHGGAALIGGLFLFVIAGALGGLRLLGMGDVKLLGAVGLFVRWPLAVEVLFYTAVAGGAVALVLAVRRGVLANVVTREPGLARHHRMPYGVAIFAGVTWAVTSQYVTHLRLM